MTKQEMIDKIYKEIANKELSFGCRITPRNCTNTMYVGDYDNEVSLVNEQKSYNTFLPYNVTRDADLNIIGHPILIGDYLDYIYKYIDLPKSKGNNGYYEFNGEVEDMVLLIELWEQKRLPIESQSEETIKFIFDKLPKND